MIAKPLPSAHLFYPENDLALARDIVHYTAPPAAVALRRAGAALPLWYGSAGDCFVSGGINDCWLAGMCDTFGIDIDVYDHCPARWQPRPWGWSKASRHYFEAIGFAPAQLPTDAELEAYRQLSHRRTAIEAARRLREAAGIGEVAVEIADAALLPGLVREYGNVIVKLPWSSSGRGLIAVDVSTLERQLPNIEGMIKRQGSVVVERQFAKTLDFALLYRLDGGVCRDAGISVFQTTGLGIYTGNILAPRQELEEKVKEAIGAEVYRRLTVVMSRVLEELAGSVYQGPLGVDFIAYQGGVSLAEINFRNTMGHVCALFYERHAQAGTRGLFEIRDSRLPDDFTAQGKKLARGHLNLVPPGGNCTFAITLA